ncbi:ketosteroid isomerase-like protein [Rhizobium sp. BK512]|uniref:nuclear transport factor 2 family protein n=1 Tax=Rhizobium sp. BK512 TaxID=2587010 RepID=UPI00161055B1|nr:nuclear transport factor 2 family protein [Rhizobium sp. BK512]MBB3564384.1 ketosteroid isomerase-like protein [Rhizobium sp. BK512]
MTSTGNLDRVLNYLRAVEAMDGERVATMLSPTVVQTELPNALKPDGGTRNLEQLLAGLKAARTILQSQRYEVLSKFQFGERVVLEVRWSGTLAVALGRLRPGEEMVCHSAMFFEFKNGLIVKQRNYDCFEPYN